MVACLNGGELKSWNESGDNKGGKHFYPWKCYVI
jgi:hypothetical protein